MQSSDDELAAAYWQNFVAMWNMPQHREDAGGAFDVFSDGLFLRVYSHFPQLWRHQALLLDANLPQPDFAAAVGAMVADFSGSSGPLGVAVAPGVEERVNIALLQHGFHRRSIGTIMGRDLSLEDLPTNPPYPSLNTHSVSEYIELANARSLVAEVFDTPLVIRNYLVDDVAYVPYIAEINQVAVASLTLVPSGDVAGIYSVATLPPYRGRGIATAMLDKVLADAVGMGFHRTVLACVPAMVRHYVRSGYRAVGTLTGYTLD